VSLGLDPALYWDLTPKEALVVADGALDRIDAEHNGRAWLAWNGAALARSRRLPRLDTLFARSRRRRRQTWREQMALCEAIARAHGGTVH
jgi:hypothetical protein